MSGSLDIIPEERREAARSALTSAFGSRPVGTIQPITGGASGALIYRAEIDGRSYVLRLEPMRKRPQDRERGHACMRAAADAGVSPALHFIDSATGVAVMDFVASRPMAEHPGGMPGLARDLGDMAARVHAAAPFPNVGDYPVMLERMLAYLRGSGLFTPGLLDRHAEGLVRIRSALQWDSAAMVSSHNDPNPRNILYDGKRLWLVDWELGWLNDPMVDIAILTTGVPPDLMYVLATAALGHAPSRAELARLRVVRQLTRLFYGCIILTTFATPPRGAPDASLAVMTAEEFSAAFADGRLTAGGRETVYEIAKMNLEGFLAGFAEPGFDEALAIVAQG